MSRRGGLSRLSRHVQERQEEAATPHRHLYLHEYPDRPMLDLGPVPPPQPLPRQVFYCCPKCEALCWTPKRCKPCGVKMSRVFDIPPKALGKQRSA